MSTNRFKLVLKPDTPTLIGIKSLNGLAEQPYLDGSGNIDMSGNYLLVKNLEAGTQSFTVNDNATGDNKGVINVFSDSSANNVANINLKHTNTNINVYENGNNRKYEIFYPGTLDPCGNNLLAGSISGSNHQTLFGTVMDHRIMQLTNSDGGGEISYEANTIYPGAYQIYGKNSGIYNNEIKNYDTWLDQVKFLEPITYAYGNGVDAITNGKFNGSMIHIEPSYTINQENNVPYQGFYASNVQNVYPPAVSNDSYQTDASDNPIYQQVDMSKLVPMCVGAIKQLDTSVNSLSTNLASANTSITNLTTELANANIIISNMYRDLYGSDTVLAILNYNWQKVPSSLYTSNTICKTIPLASRWGYLSELYLSVNKSEYNNWYFTPTTQLDNIGGYNILLDLSNNQATESIADLSGVEFIYNITQNSVYIAEYNYTEITYDYNYYQLVLSSGNYIVQDISKTAYNPGGDSDTMIGVISNLPYTSEQTLADLNFNWELVNKSKTILPQYTIAKTVPWNGMYSELKVDGGHSFRHYVENINRLTSVRWGTSQSNSLLSENARKTILSNQLTDISNNGLVTDISGVKFVYDISGTEVQHPHNPVLTTIQYVYKYYTFENNILDFSLNSAYEDSKVGVFGVIYDISL